MGNVTSNAHAAQVQVKQTTVDGEAIRYSLNGVSISVNGFSVEVIGFQAVTRDPNE